METSPTTYNEIDGRLKRDSILSNTARIDVQLLVYSDKLSPAEMSVEFAMKPTHAVSKGEKVGPSTGRTIVVHRNLWQICSEELSQATDFESHIDWMISTISTISDRLDALREANLIEVRLNCIYWTNGETAYIDFSIEQMKALSSFGADLQIAVSDYGESE